MQAQRGSAGTVWWPVDQGGVWQRGQRTAKRMHGHVAMHLHATTCCWLSQVPGTAALPHCTAQMCAPPRSLRHAVQARGHAAAARQQDQLPAGAQGAAPLVPVRAPAWLAAYQPLAKLACLLLLGCVSHCASVGARSATLLAACFCPCRMVQASHAHMPLPLIVCPSAAPAPAASSAPPSRRCAPTWPSTERLPLEQLAATLAAAAAAAATQLACWSGAAEEEAARPARARRRSARRRRRRQPGGGGSAPRPRPAARLGARLQARVNTR